jgi:hypothetical protein
MRRLPSFTFIDHAAKNPVSAIDIETVPFVPALLAPSPVICQSRHPKHGER